MTRRFNLHVARHHHPHPLSDADAAHREMLALASLALSAFIVGRAPMPVQQQLQRACGTAVVMTAGDDVDVNSPSYRAEQAAKRASDADSRRAAAKEMAASSAVIDALTAASTSLDLCWTGDEDCPDVLKSKFTQKPLDFFAVLRNPQADPDPAVWPGVREKFPALADLSDDDLLCLLQPIKDVKVDKRSLM